MDPYVYYCMNFLYLKFPLTWNSWNNSIINQKIYMYTIFQLKTIQTQYITCFIKKMKNINNVIIIEFRYIKRFIVYSYMWIKLYYLGTYLLNIGRVEKIIIWPCHYYCSNNRISHVSNNIKAKIHIPKKFQIDRAFILNHDIPCIFCPHYSLYSNYF